MKRLVLFLLSLWTLLPAGAQTVEEWVCRKNFPFTDLLDRSAEARALVAGDPVLKKLARAKYAALEKETDGTAAIALYAVSAEELQLSCARLAALSCKVPMKALADSLRRSGVYCLYHSLSDADFLQAAWKADVTGMNRIPRIYALGEKPHYAQIDSIDFDLGDSREISRVRSDVRSNILAFAQDQPFYAIPLRSALTWLDVNGRSEAADFEPLGSGINRSVYARIPGIQWERYPYPMILILGAGPHRPYETISPRSRLRARYAAELWRRGKAPLIAVSGGRVYPFKTTHTEALELKKYLMEQCGVPEDVILCDPHARHTHTNLRNIVRIMMRKGIPTDRPSLVTSSTHQIDYLTEPRFLNATTRDLGHVPFTVGKRINDREIEFLPGVTAPQVGSTDPLDP